MDGFFYPTRELAEGLLRRRKGVLSTSCCCLGALVTLEGVWRGGDRGMGERRRGRGRGRGARGLGKGRGGEVGGMGEADGVIRMGAS